jgi:hypothetical protein
MAREDLLHAPRTRFGRASVPNSSILPRVLKKATKFLGQMKDQSYNLQSVILDRVVLAPRFLQELRMLPGTKLSASAALVDSTLGTVNGVDIILQDRQSNDIVRVQLTKSLRKSHHRVIGRANISQLPSCHHWRKKPTLP